MRKRKRSLEGLDMDIWPVSSASASYVPNGTSSGHTSPLESSRIGQEATPKRTRLHNSAPGAELLKGRLVESPTSPKPLMLPPEVWQHVFAFVPPVSLGRLLSVNRTFNRLLDPSKDLPLASDPPKGRLSLRDQNHLWAASRKLFFPNFPRPMASLSELSLWKLLRSRACQYCGKKSSGNTPHFPSAPWSAGPGPENVRVVWPFGVRACSSCLCREMIKAGHLRTSIIDLLTNEIGYRAHVFTVFCANAWLAFRLLHAITQFCRLHIPSWQYSAEFAAHKVFFPAPGGSP